MDQTELQPFERCFSFSEHSSFVFFVYFVFLSI